MRLLAAIAACALACSSPDAARAEPVATPKPFSATYAVSYRGLSAGTLTFKLTHDAASGRYTYETTAKPSTIARLIIGSGALERSIMEIGPDGVRPLQWKLDDGKSGDKRDGELHFDWAAHKVIGTIEGQPIDLPTEPGLQDRLSIQVAVQTALLRNADPGTIPLIDDNRIKRYRYTRVEHTHVDSALGKLEAIVYESSRERSDRISRFWMVPELNYTPARAEQIRKGKVETVMVLTAFEPG
jgi:Protein of unknown function (DUF3108)